MKFLKGCAIGCGVVLVLGMVSCVTFVVWLQQPGEMLETERLVSGDTTGFAVWALSLDDPGTGALVHGLLDSLKRSRDRFETPLPPVLDPWLKNLQHRRDQREIQKLFPLAVSWTMRPGGPEADDLHLLAISVEKLGNRGRLVDWILGWLLDRSDEVDSVVHHGERIYQVEDGAAFFIRRSNVVVASDLGNARLAVERLQPTLGATDRAGEIDTLLASLNGKGELRCAISSRGGALERVVDAVTDDLHPLGTWDWASASALTLSGGFTDASAFQATLTVLRPDGAWDQADSHRLASIVAEALGADASGIETRGWTEVDRLVVEVVIDDLPGRVESWFGRMETDYGDGGGGPSTDEDLPLEDPNEAVSVEAVD